jgi:hypothetical protein
VSDGAERNVAVQLELRRGEGASSKLAAHDLLDIGGAVRRTRSITAIAIDSAYSPVLRTTLQRPQRSVAARRGTSTASISSAGPRAVE